MVHPGSSGGNSSLARLREIILANLPGIGTQGKGNRMKLASFELDGIQQVGIVSGSDLLVITDANWTGGKTLRAMIERDELAAAKAHASQRVALASVQLLPPVFDPPRIWCVGVNYHEHRIETGRDPTEQPTIFTRTPQSQVGQGVPLMVPAVSGRMDYEAEIAIVVGKPGRAISEAQALAHVAGYSCYNDVSIRDWQRHTSQWIPGKNFEGLGAFGPWLVTPDEMPAPDAMRVIARLNGEVLQDAVASDMIFSIPEIIAYLSTFTTLLPGDVIATGTPGGVGAKRTPPLWMKAGDSIEIEVAGVGVLTNPVV
jgi:2-keto-4-pentenoate hydratase/2-oxohepta-3-ene-1,7-dioic acid hydratase in catechol pathway